MFKYLQIMRAKIAPHQSWAFAKFALISVSGLKDEKLINSKPT